MSASRESFNIRINPRAFLRWRNWKWNKKLMFEDNFMPLVCKVIGHDKYLPDVKYNPLTTEVACKRCHRYLPLSKGV